MSKILVICDDPIDGLFVEKVLNAKRGDRIKWMPYSQQILTDMGDDLPDLIIIQFAGTNHNSVEIYQSMREKPTLQNVPILFWRVFSLKQAKEAQRLGVAGCLSIPFTPEDLVKARDIVLTGGTYYPEGEDKLEEDKPEGEGKKKVTKTQQYLPSFSARFCGETGTIRKHPVDIIGFAQFLLEDGYGPLDGEQREVIEYIYTSACRLFDLLNNLITLAKYDPKSGQDEFCQETLDFFRQNSEVLDLREVIKEILPQVKDLIICRRKDVEVEIEVDIPDKTPNIWGFKGLLDRAIKAPFESITGQYLWSKKKHFCIGFILSQSDDEVTIKIRDTRKEFDRSEIEAFNDAKNPYEASALVPVNLLVSWWAIRTLGGQMNMESKENDEVLISFILPGVVI